MKLDITNALRRLLNDVVEYTRISSARIVARFGSDISPPGRRGYEKSIVWIAGSRGAEAENRPQKLAPGHGHTDFA